MKRRTAMLSSAGVGALIMGQTKAAPRPPSVAVDEPTPRDPVPAELRRLEVEGRQQIIILDGARWRHDGDCAWRGEET